MNEKFHHLVHTNTHILHKDEIKKNHAAILSHHIRARTRTYYIYTQYTCIHTPGLVGVDCLLSAGQQQVLIFPFNREGRWILDAGNLAARPCFPIHGVGHFWEYDNFVWEWERALPTHRCIIGINRCETMAARSISTWTRNGCVRELYMYLPPRPPHPLYLFSFFFFFFPPLLVCVLISAHCSVVFIIAHFGQKMGVQRNEMEFGVSWH